MIDHSLLFLQLRFNKGQCVYCGSVFNFKKHVLVSVSGVSG